MSQITSYVRLTGPGSGSVTSVTGGVGITITGNPAVNPTVNLTVPVIIANGGTNAISFTTTDGVVYYNGTSLVTVASTGTSGQILTSNGVGLAPTFQSNSGGVITLNGDIGSATGDPITITGGSSGAIFTGAGSTLTESFNFLSLPTTTASLTAGYISIGGSKFLHAYGTGNTFLGTTSGNGTLTTASATNNTGLGINTLNALTTGASNIAIGAQSLAALTTGINNVSIGYLSMQVSTNSQSNTAIGFGAGRFITSALSNTLIGSGAGADITSGSDNVAIGVSSLSDFTTGSSSSGSNVAVGFDSLSSLATGTNNIALGSLAGESLTTSESSNIIIGSVGVVGDNNTTRIGTQGSGTAQQSTCFVAGITGVTTTNTNIVTINTSTGQLGATATPLSVALGGTNATSMTTTDGVVYFDGTRLVTTAVGTATQVLTSNGAGVAPTFQAAGGSAAFLTWNIVTGTTQAAVKANAYVANNAGTVVVTLPSTAAVGDTIIVSGMNNATGWQIAQNSGQLIHYGSSTTTTGVGGSLASTATYDLIWLTCIIANTTFIGYSSQGNITVV